MHLTQAYIYIKTTQPKAGLTFTTLEQFWSPSRDTTLCDMIMLSHYKQYTKY